MKWQPNLYYLTNKCFATHTSMHYKSLISNYKQTPSKQTNMGLNINHNYWIYEFIEHSNINMVYTKVIDCKKSHNDM